MKAMSLLLAISLCQGCIAVGAISGAALGAVTPVLIAAEKSSRYPEPVYASDRAIIITSIVGAGIGALIGWLIVSDKPKKEAHDDSRRRTSTPEGCDPAETEECEDSET